MTRLKNQIQSIILFGEYSIAANVLNELFGNDLKKSDSSLVSGIYFYSYKHYQLHVITSFETNLSQYATYLSTADVWIILNKQTLPDLIIDLSKKYKKPIHEWHDPITVQKWEAVKEKLNQVKENTFTSLPFFLSDEERLERESDLKLEKPSSTTISFYAQENLSSVSIFTKIKELAFKKINELQSKTPPDIFESLTNKHL